MKAIELTKVASWLYHNDKSNNARWEIYLSTEGKHPQDNIDFEFSERTNKVIQEVSEKLEAIEIKRQKELKRLKRRKK